MDRLRRITTLPSRLAIDALARHGHSEPLINAIARHGLIVGLTRHAWRRIRRQTEIGSGRVPDG